MPLANPPQPVVLAEDIAGLVNAIISRLIYPVSAEINPRGWEFRENSMLEEAVRFIKNEVAAELTASEAEATDLRHKLGELLAVIHRDGGHYQDFAGTEQTVADAHSAVTLLFQAQDERNDLRRNLEEARKALEHAAVAAYDEPAYLSPDGMERGADGLLPPGSPYDRGRYDARKAVENIARALKGSAQ
jgi:glutathione S-transferase